MRALIRKEWDKWAKRVIENARKHPEEYEKWEDVKKRLKV